MLKAGQEIMKRTVQYWNRAQELVAQAAPWVVIVAEDQGESFLEIRNDTGFLCLIAKMLQEQGEPNGDALA